MRGWEVEVEVRYQITDAARARLRRPALRGAGGRAAARRLARKLRARPPYGAEVRVRLAATREPA